MTLLKISDFSRLAQVPTPTLRYYDQIGLLKPAKIDPFSDYRFYEIEQLSRLNRISVLKDLGFSLDQILQMLTVNFSLDEMRDLLKARMREAEQEAKASQLRFERVAARLSEIENENAPPAFDIVLKPAPEMWVVSTRQIAAHIEDLGYFCNEIHTHLRACVRQQSRLHLAAMPAPQLLNIYHIDEYRETDIDVELCVVIDAPRNSAQIMLQHPMFDLKLYQLPAEAWVASGLFRGDMQQMPAMVNALLHWVAKNHYVVCGHVRELHFEPQDLHDIPNVVEVQLPVSLDPSFSLS